MQHQAGPAHAPCRKSLQETLAAFRLIITDQQCCAGHARGLNCALSQQWLQFRSTHIRWRRVLLGGQIAAVFDKHGSCHTFLGMVAMGRNSQPLL